MKKIIIWLQSFIIGFAKITPGVSGSVLAISFNLYDEGINAISNFFKDIKNNFKFLLFTGSGVFLGIIFGSKIINFLLKHYYLPTMFFFLGTILGGIKPIYLHVKKKLLPKNITFMIVIVILLIVIYMFVPKNNQIFKLPIFFIYIIIGFIDALTMIIPGISGTAILISLGFYPLLLECFSSFTNLNLLLINFNKVLFYLIGLIIGTIFTSKLINIFKNKYCEKYYLTIFILSISSILLLLKNINFINLQNTFLITFILFILGYKLSSSFE